MPSPQSPPPATPNTLNNNKNPYMDLISEPKSSSGMFLYPPPHGYVIPGMHVGRTKHKILFSAQIFSNAVALFAPFSNIVDHPMMHNSIFSSHT